MSLLYIQCLKIHRLFSHNYTRQEKFNIIKSASYLLPSVIMYSNVSHIWNCYLNLTEVALFNRRGCHVKLWEHVGGSVILYPMVFEKKTDAEF